jgi:hypothetical protein
MLLTHKLVGTFGPELLAYPAHRARPGLVANRGLHHLAYPTPQRLRRAADLPGDRSDGGPLRTMLSLLFQHRPHRPLLYLGGKLHSLISTAPSQESVSGKVGAVQTPEEDAAVPGDAPLNHNPSQITETASVRDAPGQRPLTATSPGLAPWHQKTRVAPRPLRRRVLPGQVLDHTRRRRRARR